MARYNRWQNENLYAIADGLPDEARRAERGAWFGSIHKTLSHLLWGDRIWMSRFEAAPKPPGGIPESVSLYPDWQGLKDERTRFDRTIVDWADAVDPSWLVSDYTYYSGAMKREITRPRWLLVTHMFNHQTHHRSQATTLIQQLGHDYGVTDFLAMYHLAPEAF